MSVEPFRLEKFIKICNENRVEKWTRRVLRWYSSQKTPPKIGVQYIHRIRIIEIGKYP